MVARRTYEIEGVACGSCEVCVLGNAALSRRIAEHFPDWKPARVTQIALSGGIGQTRVSVECTYSPTRRVCRKEIVVTGREEGLVLSRIISILDSLSEARRGRRRCSGDQ